MTKETYLQRPTSGVKYKDFDNEDIHILKRLLATKN
jgi:hypothetical protein